jgi:hypothetical protein
MILDDDDDIISLLGIYLFVRNTRSIIYIYTMLLTIFFTSV